MSWFKNLINFSKKKKNGSSPTSPPVGSLIIFEDESKQAVFGQSSPAKTQPMKQKPLASQFDNFRLIMDHKYDHERDTPEKVKNRFPGKLAPEHAVLLMREQLAFANIQELGSGCYGTAYSVQLPNGQPEAKTLVCKTYLFGRDFDYRKDSGVFGELRANLFQNFSREVSLYKKMAKHDNIVEYNSCFQVYCRNRNDSNLVIIQDQEEKLEEEDCQLLMAGLLIQKVDLTLDKYHLAHYSGQKVAPPASVVREMFIQIGSALWYLHRDLHICHNDLKLDNIGVMVDSNGDFTKLKLLDFGNSRQYKEKYYHEAEEHSWNGTHTGDNPFLKECWAFANMMIGIAFTEQLITFDDVADDVDLWTPRGKFVKFFNGDEKLKQILLKMAPKNGATYTEELVSLNWAMTKFFEQKN